MTLRASSFGTVVRRASFAALAWALAIFSSTAVAAISYVQGNYGSPNSASTVSVRYTSAQSAGDLNVVFVGWDDATSTVQSITDSNGNVYAVAAGPTVDPGNATQVVYYAKNISAAAAGANTVTVTFSGSVSYPDVRALEYSGISTTNPVDVTASNYGSSGTALSSGSLSTTTANDLLVASGNVQHTSTFVAGTGFTQRLDSSWNLVEDAMVATTGTYNATSAQNNSGYWVMQLVAFRAANTTTDTSPPTAPTGLIATSSSSNLINLQWAPASDNVAVTGYLIERCQGSSCTNFAQINSSSTTSFGDTGLNASTSYTYRVRASDAVGNLSGYSNVATGATAASGPGYVQGNSGVANSAATLTVSYGSAQTAGDLNLVFVGWSDATSSVSSISDSSGNNYSIAVGPTTQPGGVTQVIYYSKNIKNAAAGANTVSVTFNGTVTYPDVRILELSGLDAASPIDAVVSGSGTGTALSAGPLTTTSINDLLVAGGYVQHTYYGGPGPGYTKALASSWNLVEYAVAATTGAYSATSTQNTSGYWVMQLVALRAATNGGDVTPPSAPTHLTAVEDSNSHMNLAWGASSDDVGVAGYLISRCQEAGCTNFVLMGSSTTTSFIDPTAAPSSYYSYVVQATDAAGNLSSYSNVAGASTSPGAGNDGGGTTGSGGGTGSGGSGNGGTPTTTTYTYDSTGHLITVTTASGATIHYTYDAAGHLVGISTP